MALPKRKTAKQIAASRRNIIKAQRASAASRRGKSRSKKAGHHYGEGRTGRKQAKINKYGSRKHGISIAQQTRRDKRSRNRKRAASTVIAGGVIAAKAAYVYKTNPDMKRSVDTAARRAKSNANRARGTYKVNRMAGESRRRSAEWAVKSNRRR